MEEITKVRRTEIMTNEQAAKIQQCHGEFQCEIIELGIVDAENGRIVIEGTETDIDNLLQATK